MSKRYGFQGADYRSGNMCAGRFRAQVMTTGGSALWAGRKWGNDRFRNRAFFSWQKIFDKTQFYELLPLHGPGIEQAGPLSHCHGFQVHRSDPLLMLLVTPVLPLLWQIKMPAVKTATERRWADWLWKDKVLCLKWLSKAQSTICILCPFLILAVKSKTYSLYAALINLPLVSANKCD